MIGISGSIGISIFESYFKTTDWVWRLPRFVTEIISDCRFAHPPIAPRAWRILRSPRRAGHLASTHSRARTSGRRSFPLPWRRRGGSARPGERMGNHAVRVRAERPERNGAQLQPGAPLVLRFYPSVEAADKGALEYRTISHLAGAGYPVPRPYLFEPGGAAIGAPFLVMERLGGGPLFAIRSFPQAFKTFSMGFVGFVRAQARLHRMALAPSTLGALGDSGARANREPILVRKRPQDSAQRWRGRAPARTHPRDRRGARRARSAAGTGRGVGAFAPPARRSSETPHPRFSTSTTIRKTSWLKDSASPELSIGPTRQSATAISTPPPRR